jgi:hypothetical protein
MVSDEKWMTPRLVSMSVTCGIAMPIFRAAEIIP